MKIINEKETICRSMKVLYENDDDYYEDIRQKKKEGWRPVTRLDYYNDRNEIVIKTSSNGIVITYIRYDKSLYDLC